MVEATHSEHCLRCKDHVRRLLAAVYGECRPGYSFPWPARWEEYQETIIGDPLRQIHAALQRFRGHRDFVKSGRMPPCDFYVPKPGFILEFDESQHFTQVRGVALALYPPEIRVGFSVADWLDLCRVVDARDDDPPDRDERRAWYDVLRDLLPALHGFQPTVRLRWNECRWCSLDSDLMRDREKFCSMLERRLYHPKV